MMQKTRKVLLLLIGRTLILKLLSSDIILDNYLHSKNLQSTKEFDRLKLLGMLKEFETEARSSLSYHNGKNTAISIFLILLSKIFSSNLGTDQSFNEYLKIIENYVHVSPAQENHENIRLWSTICIY